MIFFDRVHFGYAKGKEVLPGVKLNLSCGKIYLLQGENGSGKTTLAKLAVKLLKPISGRVFLDGNDIAKLSLAKVASKVGYLFQNPEMMFFAPTVEDELLFPFKLKETGKSDEKEQKREDERQRIRTVLEKFGLSEVSGSCPQLLSGGEKQRLALAILSEMNVKFLILDEPSSSLDDDGRVFLAEYLTNFVENGGGVLVISHDDDLIRLLPEYTALQVENMNCKEGEI